VVSDIQGLKFSSNSHIRKAHRPSTGAGVPLLVLLLFFVTPLQLAQADEWRFSGVDRIVAVGDVHSAYDALVATLQESSVIDDSLAWSGGKTHFVITGDLLDERRLVALARRRDKLIEDSLTLAK